MKAKHILSLSLAGCLTLASVQAFAQATTPAAPAAAPPSAMAPAKKPAKAAPASAMAPATTKTPAATGGAMAPASKPMAKTPPAPAAGEAEAQAKCTGGIVVWVNTGTKVYHFKGTKDYGTTKKGAYMCEPDAIKAGDKAAKNEKHP